MGNKRKTESKNELARRAEEEARQNKAVLDKQEGLVIENLKQVLRQISEKGSRMMERR